MNKNDLVSLVAERTGFSKGDAAKAVDGVLDTITHVLKQDDCVSWIRHLQRRQPQGPSQGAIAHRRTAGIAASKAGPKGLEDAGERRDSGAFAMIRRVPGGRGRFWLS